MTCLPWDSSTVTSWGSEPSTSDVFPSGGNASPTPAAPAARRRPSSARDARREGGVRARLLEALQSAYPDALTPEEWMTVGGRCAPSRIGELVDAGWPVETEHREDGAHYRLQSTVRGQPRKKAWGVRVVAYEGAEGTPRPAAYTADVSDAATGEAVAERIAVLLQTDPVLVQLLQESRPQETVPEPEPVWGLDELVEAIRGGPR